jgi:hypothetical protein
VSGDTVDELVYADAPLGPVAMSTDDASQQLTDMLNRVAGRAQDAAIGGQSEFVGLGLDD